MAGRWRNRVLALTVVLAALAAAGLGFTSLRDSHMTKDLLGEPMRTLCVGRYLIDVPAQYELENYRYRIDGVEIEWLFRIDSEAEFEQQLAERVRTLSTEKNEYDKVSLEGSTELNTRAYRGRLLIFARSKPVSWFELGKEVFSGEGLSGEAWLWLGGHALKLSGTDLGPRSVSNVARLAAPLRALDQDETPTDPGYCMEMFDARAIIAGLPQTGQNEMTEVQFGLKNHPDVKFRWAMYTNGDKLEESLLARNARTEADMGDLLQHFAKLRMGQRTIHGVEGDELVEAVRERSGTRSHSFNWEPLGKANDPMAPSMTFEAMTGWHKDGPVNSSLPDGVALKLWDAVVGSIRLRPTGGPAKTSEAPPPNAPLGTVLVTGRTCPQTGLWQAEEGERRLLREGEPMPRTRVAGRPTLLERLRGMKPTIALATAWTLVAYEEAPGAAAADTPKGSGDGHA